MTYSRYELKYCEGCGRLSLRPSQSEQPYCVDCEQMRQFSLQPGSWNADHAQQLRRIVLRLSATISETRGTAAGVQEAFYVS